MARLLPLLVIALGIFFWYRSRKSAAGRPGRSGGAARSAPGLSKEAAALGFLPQDRQDAERLMRDPQIDGAQEAAERGAWEPAARALADAGRDWERRTALVIALAHVAAEEDAWLTAWEAACPGDPGAAAVRARSTVFLAGKLRGSSYAKETTAEQFEAFHRVLLRAREDIARAVELDAEDPSPHVSDLWAGLGLGYPHAYVDELWTEITTRAPFHFEAHYGALQYWCAKWHGSAELARDFADKAASGAPAGTLLPALRLIAFFEHLDRPLNAKHYRTPEVTAMIGAVLADLPAVRPDHPRLAEVRHLLAFFLVQQKRHAEALEQFRAVDGCVGALPWHYFGDPAKLYCDYRERAVQGAR
ncbi:hypothetical protein FGW37_02515 [Streptomyces rectiverticillatus]|uniref:hypothetical protein n=1 Tax=Streptomyces rectiverticillatus TaxID=173860 RepID=UPI0015C3567C|nr:hypothetical protein [Streptomyces rectiverticillatus]QLE70629.1 hypothetical protein FGW37_02515 [Streptomyces rectiverticillatus]